MCYSSPQKGQDPYQFAYELKRDVDDEITHWLNNIKTYLGFPESSIWFMVFLSQVYV